jgi:GNAT superfamily N-acetyltransferase
VLNAPEPISSHDEVTVFDCGVESLNHWLKTRALKNQENQASRTYVVTKANVVVAYYSLSTGAIAHFDAPKKVKHNMPDPIPVALLGRLAIDKNYYGQGLGAALLKDTVLRVNQAAQILGIKGIVVESLSKQASQFYLHHGFISFPDDELKLIMPLIKA